MKTLACYAMALFLLVGCVSTRYTGESFAPTTEVKVYYSERDVPTELEAIGVLTAEADEEAGSSQVLERLKKDAMARGADAMLVGDTTKTSAGVVLYPTTSSGMTFGDSGHQRITNAKLYRRKPSPGNPGAE